MEKNPSYLHGYTKAWREPVLRSRSFWVDPEPKFKDGSGTTKKEDKITLK